jgi:REP element-mobilizing transposase RayT
MTRHHLRRLDHVFPRDAIFFITVCVQDRRLLLATPAAAHVLLDEWKAAGQRHGWLIGRYVIMPDHVHFFCCRMARENSRDLSVFMQRWKEWTSKGLIKSIGAYSPVWQKEFFDHVLRSSESYAEKWEYVRMNPVRAGLVGHPDDWPYAGHIDFDSPRL